MISTSFPIKLAHSVRQWTDLRNPLAKLASKALQLRYPLVYGGCFLAQ
jgi:hypothetical protein